jgi:sRNA-binding regulator protein Hfq
MKPSGGKKPPVNKKPSVAPHRGGSASPSSRAPEQTFEEVRYIKYLIENEVPVRVRLRDDEEISGTIEYYDHSFIRVTRGKDPNLFIFKHDIKYLYEE